MPELSRDLDLFRELTADEFKRVEAMAETRHHRAGDPVLRQGRPADSIFVVVAGSVRVTAILAANDPELGHDEEMLVRLGPGELFGEIAFITGRPPGLSVIAETDCHLVALPHGPLHALLAADASICKKLLFAITRTLVERLGSTGRELVLARYFIRTI